MAAEVRAMPGFDIQEDMTVFGRNVIHTNRGWKNRERRIRIDMRYTFKNSGVLNIGETVKSIGREEYSKRYRHAVPMALSKLGELEDIEEELGIDLVTFHKALKNGAYYKVTDKSSINFGKIFFDRYILWGWNQNPDGTYFAIMQSQLQLFNLKDYGKTWALTKEELE